jgi:ABC-type antimicrobial peptide transport system permease subunit
MVALLSALFGFLGMALACLGLYGVMAYAVSSRRGEIGIRMALGARRGNVVRMIVRESLLLGAIGAAIGVPAALLATRFIAGYLFGVTPSDPMALLLATLIMVSVATVAGYLPARVASSLDPLTALRGE